MSTNAKCENLKALNVWFDVLSVISLCAVGCFRCGTNITLTV
jgi:hypothetical protein